ncbi:unannotated protein [freshwater metagenome]|uniref:Unannotated protein n=1 Tax=freshwater metagenome TaxID=449393 RepID=A0A6J6IEW8_9ZZZZ|nr:hypothetical protein [Actinomycetota bacterium]MSY38817.1 hypothetical protein [Actinomycetota bacterium]MSZ41587.1 hypothetical protein [Actinomycetota bacterium]
MPTDPTKPTPDKPKMLEVDLLPDVTRDEEGGFESRDEFLRGEVPPHHGG